MGSRKTSKNTNHRSDRKYMLRAKEQVMEAQTLFRDDGYLSGKLFLSVEKARNEERRLRHNERLLFRTIMTHHVSRPGDGNNIYSRSWLENVELTGHMRSNKGIKNYISINLPFLYAEIYRQRVRIQSWKQESMIFMNNISQWVDEKYISNGQDSEYGNYLYSDPMASTFNRVIRWQSIFTSSITSDWARNAAELAVQLMDGSVRKEYEQIRYNVMRDIMEYYASYVPICLKEIGAPETTRGAPIYNSIPQKAPVKQTADKPAVKLCVLAEPYRNAGAMEEFLAKDKAIACSDVLYSCGHSSIIGCSGLDLYGNAGAESHDATDMEYMITVSGALHCTTASPLHRFYKWIIEKHTPTELIYTAMSLMAGYNDAGEYPVMLQALLWSVFFCTPKSCQHKKTYEKYEGGDSVSVISTYTPHPCLAAYCEGRGDEDFCANNYEGDGKTRFLTLAEHMRSKSMIMLSPQLTLSQEDKLLYENMGYTEEQALMLCGYASACGDTEGSWGILWKYDIDELEGYYSEDELRKKSEEAAEKVRRDMSEEIRRSRADREAAAAEVRKHEKTIRAATYRADKNERDLKAAMDEITQLQRQNERLRQENREMKQLIEACSSQGFDDEEDGSVPSEAYMYPMPEIGRATKVLILGGSQRWANEISRRFPAVSAYSSDDIPHENAFVKPDILMVNTFKISHHTYWRIQAFAEKNNIKMSFFFSRGINACSRRIIDVVRMYEANK